MPGTAVTCSLFLDETAVIWSVVTKPAAPLAENRGGEGRVASSRSAALAGLDVLLELTGAVIALAGIAALAALMRRHTGMAIGAALSLVALVGLAGLVWVVFARLAVALVTGM